MAVWAALALGVLSGCTPPPNAPLPSDPIAAAPLVEERPLQSHIPSVGLRWLVELKPKDLLENPQFVQDWSPVFQADRIQAFTTTSGVQVEQVDQVWIAGYDLGTLYVIDGKTTGTTAEKAFRDRALTSSDVKTDYENLTHMTGMIEQTPHALVHVHGHLVAIAIGDIRLARIVRAYAEGKLKNTAPAMQSSLVAPFAQFKPEAPVRAFVLGPFEDATDAAVGGFVSGAAAVSFEEEALKVTAQALGLWPSSMDLSSRLTDWTDQVLSTREFRALGWGFPTTSPQVRCKESGEDQFVTCDAAGQWNSGEVAEALRRITSGTLKEIVAAPSSRWKPEATTRPSDEAALDDTKRDENESSDEKADHKSPEAQSTKP